MTAPGRALGNRELAKLLARAAVRWIDHGYEGARLEGR